ncbi:hypothetical protein STAQ_04150 [Allostella sp. ATCC 35155]|nr:hypothetical protein STAQ_04150 [Stella sp. ATCC 35155]
MAAVDDGDEVAELAQGGGRFHETYIVTQSINTIGILRFNRTVPAPIYRCDGNEGLGDPRQGVAVGRNDTRPERIAE